MPGRRAREVRADTSKVKFVRLLGEAGTNKAGQKIIGPKRMKELKKTVANYERRMKRRIKGAYGEVTWENVNKYRRTVDRAPNVEIDLSTMTSVREFNQLIKWLNTDKTKAYKQELTTLRRDWMKKMVTNGYDIDANSNPELFAAIDRMSATDILRWETEHSDLVGDLFYHYEDIWDQMNRTEWAELVNSLIDSVQEYSTIKIPYVE